MIREVREVCLVSNDDPDDAAGRLEAALERIAALAQRRPAPPEAAAAPDTRVLAERLDLVIAQLRKGLGPAGT